MVLAMILKGRVGQLKAANPNKTAYKLRELLGADWDYIGTYSEKQNLGKKFYTEVVSHPELYAGWLSVTVSTNKTATYHI